MRRIKLTSLRNQIHRRVRGSPRAIFTRFRCPLARSLARLLGNQRGISRMWRSNCLRLRIPLRALVRSPRISPTFRPRRNFYAPMPPSDSTRRRFNGIQHKSMLERRRTPHLAHDVNAKKHGKDARCASRYITEDCPRSCVQYESAMRMRAPVLSQLRSECLAKMRVPRARARARIRIESSSASSLKFS